MQKRTADSEHVFQTGIPAAKRSGDDFIAAYLYRAYGQVLCQEERSEEGLESLAKAFDLFSQLQMNPEVEKTDQLISTCAG